MDALDYFSLFIDRGKIGNVVVVDLLFGLFSLLIGMILALKAVDLKKNPVIFYIILFLLAFIIQPFVLFCLCIRELNLSTFLFKAFCVYILVFFIALFRHKEISLALFYSLTLSLPIAYLLIFIWFYPH